MWTAYRDKAKAQQERRTTYLKGELEKCREHFALGHSFNMVDSNPFVIRVLWEELQKK